MALSQNDFLKVLRRSADLAMAVIQELTRRLRQVDEQASSLSFQRVKERTMGLLVRLATEEHGETENPLGGRRQVTVSLGYAGQTRAQVIDAGAHRTKGGDDVQPRCQ